MWKLAYQGMLSGPPVAMGRPRITKTGRAYTPETSRSYKDSAIKALRSSCGDDWSPLDGCLRISITFIHPRTKNLHLKAGELSQGRIWRAKKPDIDNLLKMVLDCITQADIWIDDNRVVSLSCEDMYCGVNEDAHTLFSIYQWEIEGGLNG